MTKMRTRQGGDAVNRAPQLQRSAEEEEGIDTMHLSIRKSDLVLCVAIWAMACINGSLALADTETNETPRLGSVLYLESLEIAPFPTTEKEDVPPPLATQCIFQPLARFRVLMNADIVAKGIALLSSKTEPTDQVRATLAYLQSCITNRTMTQTSIASSSQFAFPWDAPILPRSTNITLVSSAPADVPAMRISVTWRQSPSYVSAGIGGSFPNSKTYPLISVSASLNGTPILSKTVGIQFPQSLPVGGLNHYIWNETMAEMMKAFGP